MKVHSYPVFRRNDDSGNWELVNEFAQYKLIETGAKPKGFWG